MGVSVHTAIGPDCVDRDGMWVVNPSSYQPEEDGTTSMWLAHVQEDVNQYILTGGDHRELRYGTARSAGFVCSLAPLAAELSAHGDDVGLL